MMLIELLSWCSDLGLCQLRQMTRVDAEAQGSAAARTVNASVFDGPAFAAQRLPD